MNVFYFILFLEEKSDIVLPRSPHEDDTLSGFFVRSLPKFLLYPRGVEISQYCSMDTLMLLIIFYFFIIS